MVTAVARRSAPSSLPLPEPAPPEPAATVRDHVDLDEAARRWLTEGDTPDNVAAYASALRALLRAR
jgi:hypothetical protein